MAQTYILIIQARIFWIVGIAWLAFGLYQGFDPLTVAWRAAAAALLTLLITGALLRIGLRAVAAGILNQERERQQAEHNTEGASA